MRSSIITDRPNAEKNGCFPEADKSSDSETEVVLELDDVSIDSSSNEEFNYASNVSKVPSELSHNSFVVVTVYRPSSLTKLQKFYFQDN